MKYGLSTLYNTAINKETAFYFHACLGFTLKDSCVCKPLLLLLVDQTVTTLHDYPVALSDDLLPYIEGKGGSKTSVTGVEWPSSDPY